MVQIFTFSANHDKAFFLVVGRHQFIFEALPGLRALALALSV